MGITSQVSLINLSFLYVNSFVTSVQRFVSAAYLELKIQTDKPVLAHTNSPENKLRKQKMSFPVFAFVYSSSAPALPGPTFPSVGGGGGGQINLSNANTPSSGSSKKQHCSRFNKS